jgi:hypothetical protein
VAAYQFGSHPYAERHHTASKTSCLCESIIAILQYGDLGSKRALSPCAPKCFCPQISRGIGSMLLAIPAWPITQTERFHATPTSRANQRPKRFHPQIFPRPWLHREIDQEKSFPVVPTEYSRFRAKHLLAREPLGFQGLYRFSRNPNNYKKLGNLLSLKQQPKWPEQIGSDTVLAQLKSRGAGPINRTLEMPGPNHRPLSVRINRSLNAAAERSITSSAFFIGAM